MAKTILKKKPFYGFFGFAALFIAAMLVTGCGPGGPAEAELTANGASISGDAAPYFAVQDGTYTLKRDDNNVQVTVKLAAGEGFDKDAFRQEKGDVAEKSDFSVSPSLRVLDKDGGDASGNRFDTLSPEYGQSDKLKELLTAPKGKTISVTFTGTVYDKKRLEDLMKNAASFELTGANIRYTKVKSGTDAASVIKSAIDDLDLSLDDLKAADDLAKQSADSLKAAGSLLKTASDMTKSVDVKQAQDAVKQAEKATKAAQDAANALKALGY